jgi:hypothetical protein
MSRRVRLGLALGLALAVAVPVSAQMIVLDPAVLDNAVTQLIELEESFAELVATYQQIRTQYLLLQHQAQGLPVDLATRYRTVRSPWLGLSATSAYGLTTTWVTAANTGAAASTGYTRATEALRPYGSAMARLSAEEAARVQARVDRVDLGDATAVHGLQALGLLRAREASVETALANLEADTFTGNADFNTQVAVLNKINATTVTTARVATDTNNLLVSLLEQQLLDATERREAAVEGINAHIAFETDAPALLAASTSQTTTALTTFRIP